MTLKHIFFGLPSLTASILGTRKAPSPIYLQIEPTSRCNLNCAMCFRDECPYTLGKDMSLSYFKEIIDQFRLQYVYLTGYGEPFLHKDLLKMVDYAAQAGATVEITTNGTLLDQTTCQEIVQSQVSRLNISLDGIKTFKQIRGIKPDIVLKAIENMSSLNISNKIDLNVNTVVLKDNLDDLTNLVDHLAPFPITLNLKTNRPNKKYTKARYDDVVAATIQQAETKGLKTNYVKYIPTPYCYRIYFAGNVNAEGDLFVCCNLFKKVGHILKDGWNSPEFQHFRDRFNHEFPKECRICNLPFNQKVHKILGWLKKRA